MVGPKARSIRGTRRRRKEVLRQAVSTGEVKIDQITRRIEKISTVSGADIRAVLYALIDVVPEELAAGNILRIGYLGYFRISLNSVGHEVEEDLNEEKHVAFSMFRDRHGSGTVDVR